jgi:hypothetical protein
MSNVASPLSETAVKRIKEVKVSNDELTELLVWAYKQGFLDAAQVLTESVKSLDDAKIRAQLSEGLEALSKPAAPDKQRMIQHLRLS